ncbi:hypothetical protein [Chitinilyticum aquatile]|uniref:hypothetical protein n=1 Tax=Chitinilyticum aquatile TaxID=362520 RepID=UPI0004204C17|nr:hypothetical protein [Chitinilyticum aquatile]
MEVKGNNVGDTGAGFDSLAALQSMAEVHDAEVVAPFLQTDLPQDAGGSEQVDGDYTTVTEAKCLLKAGRLAAGQFYSCIGRIYTDETIDGIAEALAPVMDKYGLTGGDFFKQWGPEIGLAMVVIPLGYTTVQAIRAENEMRRMMVDAARKQGGANAGQQHAEEERFADVTQ